MILAGVADLLFSSRIRAAADACGADVRFARTVDNLLKTADSLRPSLVLLDLNAAPLAPIDAVARLKADAGTRAIRVVGFVSHVQADVVVAARAAGIDEVMARSAFVARLPELLAGRG